MYFEYFANAKIKHGEKSVHKNLGSFFSKFTHTFKPTEYCALDNPIKNYFKLKNESFYLAFIIISNAYREFINENFVIVENIITQLELNNIVKSFSPKFTDLKLLDLIFWFEANEANKDSSNQ